MLVDGQDNVLAGEGRVKAARQLGLQQIPALKIEHLNAAEKRAFVLADNKLAEGSGWSSDILTLELQELADLDFNLELTGFSPGEIDALLDTQHSDEEDADDICLEYDPSQVVTQTRTECCCQPVAVLFVNLSPDRSQLRTGSADTFVMFRIDAFERNLVPLVCKNSTRRANSLESYQLIGRRF